MRQRVLLSVATLEGWEVASLSIGTAFLQGTKPQGAETTTGQQRSGAMRPPADAWEYLPRNMLPAPFGEFDVLANALRWEFVARLSPSFYFFVEPEAFFYLARR